MEGMWGPEVSRERGILIVSNNHASGTSIADELTGCGYRVEWAAAAEADTRLDARRHGLLIVDHPVSPDEVAGLAWLARCPSRGPAVPLVLVLPAGRGPAAEPNWVTDLAPAGVLAFPFTRRSALRRAVAGAILLPEIAAVRAVDAGRSAAVLADLLAVTAVRAGADAGGIWILDPDEAVYVLRARYEIADDGVAAITTVPAWDVPEEWLWRSAGSWPGADASADPLRRTRPDLVTTLARTIAPPDAPYAAFLLLGSCRADAFGAAEVREVRRASVALAAAVGGDHLHRGYERHLGQLAAVQRLNLEQWRGETEDPDTIAWAAEELAGSENLVLFYPLARGGPPVDLLRPAPSAFDAPLIAGTLAASTHALTPATVVRVATERRPRYWADPRADPALFPAEAAFLDAQGVASLAAFPLAADEYHDYRVVGVLWLAFRRPFAFDPQDRRIMELFARQAAARVDYQRAVWTGSRWALGRDLHDAVKSNLRGLDDCVGDALEALEALPSTGPAGEARRQLHQARHLATLTLLGVKLTMNNFAQAPDEEPLQPLRDLLREELSGHEARWPSGSFRWHVDDSLPPLPTRSALEVAWLVGEAVANARAHARPARTEVRVTAEDDAIEIVVADDGVGFDPGAPRPAHHRGLRIMHQRVRSLRGTLVVESTPIHRPGTAVTIRLPRLPSWPAWSAAELDAAVQERVDGAADEPF